MKHSWTQRLLWRFMGDVSHKSSSRRALFIFERSLPWMLFSNYLAGGGFGTVMLLPLYGFHQMLLRSQRSSRSAPLLLPSEVIISPLEFLPLSCWLGLPPPQLYARIPLSNWYFLCWVQAKLPFHKSILLRFSHVYFNAQQEECFKWNR